jgi:hypothetical protein
VVLCQSVLDACLCCSCAVFMDKVTLLACCSRVGRSAQRVAFLRELAGGDEQVVRDLRWPWDAPVQPCDVGAPWTDVECDDGDGRVRKILLQKQGGQAKLNVTVNATRTKARGRAKRWSVFRFPAILGVAKAVGSEMSGKNCVNVASRGQTYGPNEPARLLPRSKNRTSAGWSESCTRRRPPLRTAPSPAGDSCSSAC